MIVGWTQLVFPATVTKLDWTCGPGEGGDVVGLFIPDTLIHNFHILAFDLQKKNGDVERLVWSEESVRKVAPGTCWHCGMNAAAAAAVAAIRYSPSPLSKPAGPTPIPASLPLPKICDNCSRDTTAPEPQWSGGVAASVFIALSARAPIEWDVEEGDKITCVLTNVTAGAQTFAMGWRMVDRSVSKQKLWWANVETGKLDRAVAFDDRHLLPGTRRDGFVIVDPTTYDGFDMPRSEPS